MGKKTIIGTGLSGLVGSRIIELLSDTYEFIDLSRKTGTDITDRSAVTNAIKKYSSSTVLHLAAKTDVDACEQDKPLGENGEAWIINVKGTKHIIAACEETGKKIIYVSTDMVFQGDKPLGEAYGEDDHPNPCNWYAQTKYEAEKIIQTSRIPWLIIRIAYPYRAHFEKKEYVRIFLSLLENNREIQAVEDHYFTPTFVDDMSAVIDQSFRQSLTGIFHAVGGEAVSPYQAALEVAKTFQLDGNLIKKTTRSEFFKDRAPRPFNLALKNAKIEQKGISMHSFEEGLKEMKSQMEYLV